MNRVLLGLNILLLLAVGYLFLDKFSTSEPKNDETSLDLPVDQVLNIVYVNTDTLLNEYTLFNEQQKAISTREKTADAKLKAQARALEREIMMLNEKASKGTMTPKDLQAEEQRLTLKQQQLMADQENITKELMTESSRINDELQKEISSALRVIQAQYNYDYVLSYGSGSPVLAVNDSFDITREVIQRLNNPKTK
ncbi:MAG: OmpH family outer membrane protein [Saprospiraceae bacterium]|nr:OmpH family outer membrane protein [Saprospiraceae bacterium]